MTVLILSLGPGSAVGEKSKKRGQIGKISASGCLGVATLSPPQNTSRFASLADFFFRSRRFFCPFPPMQSLVPGHLILDCRNISHLSLNGETFSFICWCFADKYSLLDRYSKFRVKIRRTNATVSGVQILSFGLPKHLVTANISWICDWRL